MKLPAVFERYRSAIDAELRSTLAAYQGPLYDMLRYHLGWMDADGNPLASGAGKALRPTLCLLACECSGTDYRKALPAAAAVELVHNFSLIHDDVQDGDRERRHRPAVWSVWGKAQAINAGTAMRIIASLAIQGLSTKGISLEKQLRAQRLLDDSCLHLIEGQYLDISYERRIDIGVSDYLAMIEGKTASLMAGSLEVGMLLGSDDESAIQAFRRFGLNLGFAFQIRDDVLGIWGDERKTGKPVGSDILRRKKSFPVVYALETASDGPREELISIYQRGSAGEGELQRVLGILDEVEARAYSEAVADHYRARALAEIKKVSISSQERQDLEEMACFLTEREY